MKSNKLFGQEVQDLITIILCSNEYILSFYSARQILYGINKNAQQAVIDLSAIKSSWSIIVHCHRLKHVQNDYNGTFLYGQFK